MARHRSIRVCALNVVLIDHEKHNQPQWYEDLFRAMYALRTPVRVQGDRRLTIGSMFEDGGSLMGVIDRYTEIDADRWYNREQRRRATKAELGRIVVPQDMAANFQDFYYSFDTKAHVFAFLSAAGPHKMSARQAHKLVETLASNPRIKKRFGTVAVSIEQEPATIERILTAEQLRYISITLNRPNSTLGSYDEQFDQKLTRMRAAKQSVQLWADDSGSLIVPEDLRNAARSAASNGSVSAKIFEDKHVEEITTEDSPITEREPYDTKLSSALAAFRKAAERLIARVSRRSQPS